MEITTQPRIRFLGVDFTEVLFTSTNPNDRKGSIDLKVQPYVYYPPDHSTQFKIIMLASVKYDGFFSLSIKSVGHFEHSVAIEEEHMKQTLINTNAPAIMFPYLRAFIATFTSNLGNSTGLIQIPPKLFHGNLEVLPKEFIQENA